MSRIGIFISMILFAFMLTIHLPIRVCASADDSLKAALPPKECIQGWVLDEPVKSYDPETLFEHINGEAELYYPYGFEALATAIYTDKTNPKQAVLADVYRMDSLLNAFGIYSNYRRPHSEAVAIGAEGFASPSQLMFYQGNYFVRLQASGTSVMDQNVLIACGRAISQRLLPNANLPKEVESVRMPDVVPRSERYIAHSLLGYAFFRRGLIADAYLDGERVQVFVVTEDSKDRARKAFDNYRSYLTASGRKVDIVETPERIALVGIDPLYGRTFAEQSGQCIIGITKMIKTADANALALIDRLRERFIK